jgi:hypothetical protein
VLCDRIRNPICETCRVLMSRGIVGAFETWKAGIPYPSMVGDIEKTAGLTVSEPDIPGRDCKPRFKSWKAYSSSQDALSLHSVDAPTREEDEAGRGVAADTITRSRVGGFGRGYGMTLGEIADQSGQGDHETEHIACSDGATRRTA